MVCCTKCKEFKDESCFSKNKQKKNGLGSWCNSCKGKSVNSYKRKKRKKVLDLMDKPVKYIDFLKKEDLKNSIWSKK